MHVHMKKTEFKKLKYEKFKKKTYHVHTDIQRDTKYKKKKKQRYLQTKTTQNRQSNTKTTAATVNVTYQVHTVVLKCQLHTCSADL